MLWKESVLSRFALEQLSRELRLTNDRMQRAEAKLFVIGNRNRNRRFTSAFLHHDMTATPANFSEPVCNKNRTDLRAGNDAELTQR